MRRAEQNPARSRVAVVERDGRICPGQDPAAIADARGQNDACFVYCPANIGGGQIRLGIDASRRQRVQAVIIVNVPVVDLVRGNAAIIVDVGDVIGVLVPGLTRGNPLIRRIAEHLDAGGKVEPIIIADHDNLGVAVCVHVRNHRQFVRCAAGTGRLPKNRAVAAAINPQF